MQGVDVFIRECFRYVSEFCFLGDERMMVYHQEDKHTNIRLGVYSQADIRVLKFKSQDPIASIFLAEARLLRGSFLISPKAQTINAMHSSVMIL